MPGSRTAATRCIDRCTNGGGNEPCGSSCLQRTGVTAPIIGATKSAYERSCRTRASNAQTPFAANREPSRRLCHTRRSEDPARESRSHALGPCTLRHLRLRGLELFERPGRKLDLTQRAGRQRCGSGGLAAVSGRRWITRRGRQTERREWREWDRCTTGPRRGGWRRGACSWQRRKFGERRRCASSDAGRVRRRRERSRRGRECGSRWCGW
jgi:hypothetical protein